MSILIKGMEMPKSCGDCPCLGETYCCCVDGVYPYDCNILIQETEEGSEFIGRLSNCPLTEAPKWVPVTERLPKENGFYLCLYKHKASGGVAMDEGLSILQWINNKWGINDIYLVTHWLPIPEPPKEET